MTFDPNHPTPPEPFSPAALEPSSVPTSPVVPTSIGAAPAPIVVKKKSGAGGRLLNIVLAAALAVAIGGVAFAVGRSTAPVSAATGTGRGGFGGGFGGAGGLTVSGTVVSVNGDTLTIQTASGQTIEVTTGASTTYHSQAPATASDVQAGKTVQVQLDLAGGGTGRPSASAGTTTGPVGTAGSVTVVP